MPLYNIQSGIQYALIVHAGDDPGIIVNRDLVNLVHLGDHPGFNLVAEGNILDPLTFVQYSGDDDVYAICDPGKTATIDVQTGNQNWSPSPVQAAQSLAASGLMLDSTGQSVVSTLGNPSQQSLSTLIPGNIFVTGVPLYTKSTIGLNTQVSIPANQTYTSPITPCNQIGFELRVNALYNSTGAQNNSVFQATINWYDSTTGLLIDQDQYVGLVRAPTDTTGFTTNIKGPSKGDQFQLLIKNCDPTGGSTQTVGIVFLLNSRVYNSDQIYTPNFGPASVTTTGFQIGNSGDDQYISAGQNTALAANSTDYWVIPPNIGQVWFNLWETGVSGSNISARLNNIPNTGVYSSSGNAMWVFNDVMVAGNPNKLEKYFVSSGGPMELRIQNASTTTAAFYSFVIIGAP